MTWIIKKLVEKSLLPDFLLRIGIRRLLSKRLRELPLGHVSSQVQYINDFVKMMNQSPVAVETQKANEQHYEVPTSFFQLVLGKHMKYSSCFWGENLECHFLNEAEKMMLDLTIKRAQIQDGDRILELGCGWGSLSLYMAEKFPMSKIMAISNSKSQKKHIDEQAQKRGLRNLSVQTINMIDCDFSQVENKFNKVISIEMFEHMRNFNVLFERISHWTTDDAFFFLHIFVHKSVPYLFEVKDESDWMSKYFFSGGMMPHFYMPYHFSQFFQVIHSWGVSGLQYKKTSDAWLKNMDLNQGVIYKMFKETYKDKGEALKWWSYWRIFFLSCSELWGYRKGNEWMVGHYLMKKKSIDTIK